MAPPSVADTIFALSSGRPPAAIAVVRVSGPVARRAVEALTGDLPEPRKAALRRVRDPESGEVIDEALLLWFPAPRSETGEDVAEFQLHGGRAVIAGVLDALSRVEGLRPAEAGEFTRRAFENGQLDLTEVEGLADLIGAETDAQRRQAFRQLKGLLGNRAEAWRGRLIEALALVEARIDFSDEADVPEDLVGPALSIARELRAEIAEVVANAGRGERLREGLVVAIAGPPNAGKSTLLNRIAQREVAIVSPIPGTTRDVIEVHLDLGGYPVTLLDTAGVRDSEDPIEREGVRRARERAAEADLVLWVTDARDHIPWDQASDTPRWVVRNKADLLLNALDKNNNVKNEFVNSNIEFTISATCGFGVEQLLAEVTKFASKFFGSEPALVTRQRHRRALQDTVAALDRALVGANVIQEDIIAEEVRLAATVLGRLTGRIDVEDILDVIFRDFCIGK